MQDGAEGGNISPLPHQHGAKVQTKLSVKMLKGILYFKDMFCQQYFLSGICFEAGIFCLESTFVRHIFCQQYLLSRICFFRGTFCQGYVLQTASSAMDIFCLNSIFHQEDLFLLISFVWSLLLSGMFCQESPLSGVYHTWHGWPNSVD